jgi:tRNA (cmo5U34)-methyltransferase
MRPSTDVPSDDSTHHQPSGQWVFDESVTRCFDDMLARSIPQYEALRDLVTRLAIRYAQDGTDVVDLGCSRGSGLAPIAEALRGRCQFVGTEISESMLVAARDRFADRQDVRIEKHDLRGSYPDVSASVTLAVLTLQFVPVEYRQRIVTDIYRSTVPGGAFIFTEKVIGATVAIDETFVAEYHAYKLERGYSQDAIDLKRQSLENVLIPLRAEWNQQILRDAGFRQLECVWRWMNFAAWVAIKD